MMMMMMVFMMVLMVGFETAVLVCVSGVGYVHRLSFNPQLRAAHLAPRPRARPTARPARCRWAV